MAEKSKTTLIITEKPAAAEKIAAALSDAKDEKITNKDKVSYYEFYKDNHRYLVGCAVGHLFGIQQIAKRGPFPNFEVEWQPAYQKKSGSFTKRYLSVLKRLAKEADDFIVATDFDVEGEVIGWNAVRFACGVKNLEPKTSVDKLKKGVRRMKFSLLTKEALEKSFDDLIPGLNWGAAVAGESRHYIDWFYGINLSRGLMKALSSTGTFRILSIGRVQGPALKIITDREREIEDFKPEPYWNVFLQIKDIKGNRLEVKYPKDIFNESELLKFKHLKGKEGVAKTTVKENEISAPTPFDLTTLQTEAYKYCGYTPAQTLKSAQALYLAGLISYPRTSSQKYDPSIGYDSILKRLKKYTTTVKYAVNKKPTEGTKTDPAHPAIYPTGESKKIGERDKKIYDLIVKRFISCFADSAKVERKRVSVKVNGLGFSANGTLIKDKGWMNVYPYATKESKIPAIDGNVDVLEIRTEEKETKPPSRYSAASLVKELEKRGLGTKATRAAIVETLYSRGYAREKAIEVTELGKRMCDTLEKFAPIILDEKMTKDMGIKLESMEDSNFGGSGVGGRGSGKDVIEMEREILEEAKVSVTRIAEGMSENFEKMGESLADANLKVIEEEKEANTMSKCPKCGKGRLRISYGKRFDRYFVSCDSYPECKNTYSLPAGLAKPARLSRKEADAEGRREGDLKFCEVCGFPKVVMFRRGKSLMEICFNSECPTNEEYEKKKAEFKEKLASGEIEVVDGKFVDHAKEALKKKKASGKKVVGKNKGIGKK